MDFFITEEMIRNSLVSRGCVTALAKVFEKTKRGEDITIAFLGGSITQGFNSTKQENCYVSKTYLWFKNTFSNINVSCINAGVGATGSIIGVHRVEKEVLSYNPDILFIDFAVNDKKTIYDKVAYESLVRRVLSLDNPPAIIEIFMSNFDGSNVQEQQIQIGRKYNIPMISFRDAIHYEISKGSLKWGDVATDEVHPNDYGHFIISELLIDFMKNIYNNLEDIEDEKTKLGDVVFGDKYINGIIKNNKNLKVIENIGFNEDLEGFQVFHDGWKFDSEKEDKTSLEVEIRGKNIFLLYKKSIKETAGKIQVIVDENKPIIIDTFFENGWGDYSATELLLEEEKLDSHRIQISVINENKISQISILGFLVS
ncbi:SGNH/GDSL hydrolase family protein [Clostridium nigeriense]|uniref:SGNH/GDSL hydrolase family protein n=1 Tax=Clostridium nigeriense TaxID=1805470 RepID=UPI003D33C497